MIMVIIFQKPDMRYEVNLNQNSAMLVIKGVVTEGKTLIFGREAIEVHQMWLLSRDIVTQRTYMIYDILGETLDDMRKDVMIFEDNNHVRIFLI